MPPTKSVKDFLHVATHAGRKRYENDKYIVFTKPVRVKLFQLTVTHMDVSRRAPTRCSGPISWREKQQIKNALFGNESTAVEVFPPESELVGRKLPHWSLWILPKALRFPVLVKES